jgi:hypothetical protein
MRLERALSALILIDVVLGVTSIASEATLERHLPGSLRAYLAVEGALASDGGAWIRTGLWWGVIVGTVLAWIGLFNLLRAARPLYLGSWVGYLILVLIRGPVVTTAVGEAIQILLALTGGAILATIYLSEQRTRFRRLSEWAAGAAGRPA